MAPRLAADARQLSREQLVALRGLLAAEAVPGLLAPLEDREELHRMIARVDERLQRTDHASVRQRQRIAGERRPSTGNA